MKFCWCVFTVTTCLLLRAWACSYDDSTYSFDLSSIASVNSAKPAPRDLLVFSVCNPLPDYLRRSGTSCARDTTATTCYNTPDEAFVINSGQPRFAYNTYGLVISSSVHCTERTAGYPCNSDMLITCDQVSDPFVFKSISFFGNYLFTVYISSSLVCPTYTTVSLPPVIQTNRPALITISGTNLGDLVVSHPAGNFETVFQSGSRLVFSANLTVAGPQVLSVNSVGRRSVAPVSVDVQATPVISRITPRLGPVRGGNAITIQGSIGVVSSATVGEVSAVVLSASDGIAVISAPLSEDGAVVAAIVITTSTGLQSLQPVFYTYLAPGRIASVVPSTPISGSLVTIIGTNLGVNSDVNAVTLCHASGTVLFVDGDTITARLPDGVSGPCVLTVGSPTRGEASVFVEVEASGLGTGAIVGIAVGTAAAVAIAVAVGVFVWRRRRLADVQPKKLAEDISEAESSASL